MFIVKPNVELWTPLNATQHIARCARVCYGSKGVNAPDKEKDEKLLQRLIKSHHKSVFRHYTHYYIVEPNDYINNDDLYSKIIEILHNPFVDIRFRDENRCYYIAVNGNFILDNDFEIFNPYEVSVNKFVEWIEALNMVRFTFGITTQISTSRELNRVSPNNIAEESTRYVNYNGEKVGKEITYCQPAWMDMFLTFESLNDLNNIVTKILYDGKTVSAIVNGKCIQIPLNDYKIKTTDDKTDKNAKVYLGYLHKISTYYKSLIKHKFLPQEAREVLALNTATFVVYTYSYDEWIKILLLRYYGVTGVPHPNAKIIANKIRNEFIRLGYNVDDRAKELAKEIYNIDL